MQREDKEKLVGTLHEALSETTLVVIAHQTGLTVAEMTDLRRRMRAAGASFKVTKNRLAKRALDGTKFTGVSDLFTGPSTVAYSKDPVAAAKVAVEFAGQNGKFVVIGGALGEQVLDVKQVEALAKLPSLDALRGKLIGVLQAPATKVAGVLAAPAGQLARVFAAYSDKQEAA